MRIVVIASLLPFLASVLDPKIIIMQLRLIKYYMAFRLIHIVLLSHCLVIA